MTASTTTTVSYPKSDTATGNINNAILKRELEDVELSVVVNDVREQGTIVQIDFGGLVSTGDLAMIDSVVEAHQGGTVTPETKQVSDESEEANATTTWLTRATLTTGLLVGGTYEVQWFAEIAMDSGQGGTTEAEILVGEELVYSVATSGTSWFPLGGLRYVDVKVGDAIEVALRFRKSGSQADMAKIRRSRLAVKPLSFI